MFDDVAQLQNEIEQFRNNILVSNELIEKLENLKKVIETENNQLEKTGNIINQFAEESKKEILTNSSKILENNKELRDKLSELVREEVNNSNMNLRNTNNKLDQTIKEITKISEDYLKTAEEKNDKLAQFYIEKITELLGQVEEYKTQLIQYQNTYIEIIKKSKVENVFDRVSDIDKKIDKKFNLIVVVFLIIAVLEVIQLIR